MHKAWQAHLRHHHELQLTVKLMFTHNFNTRARVVAAAEVLSMAKTRNFMASGSVDGCIKLWALDTGQATDAKSQPGGSAVTALAFAGPLMVHNHGATRAAGSRHACMLRVVARMQ